jgi:hypothetical protein
VIVGLHPPMTRHSPCSLAAADHDVNLRRSKKALQRNLSLSPKVCRVVVAVLCSTSLPSVIDHGDVDHGWCWERMGPLAALLDYCRGPRGNMGRGGTGPILHVVYRVTKLLS